MHAKRPIYNILFLCTGNSARSIMAEGLLNLLGQGRFKAYSAGSNPTGKVNPHAIELLKACGCDIEQLHSKSWHEFEDPDAPHMDLVITVCDNAHGKVCPLWLGHPMTTHWGYADPIGNNEAETRATFLKVFTEIKLDIEHLVNLSDVDLQPINIKNALKKIRD